MLGIKDKRQAFSLEIINSTHVGVEDGVGQLDGGEIEEIKQNKIPTFCG